MGPGSHDAYAQWTESMFGSAEVANFKALDPDVAFVLNGEYGAPS